jgi:hypothetical protein
MGGMNKRLAPRSTTCTVSIPPATVRQFAVDQGEFLIEHLEGLVDSMVSGEIPRRHMLLVGPLASGKRALARTVAAEFCTRVVELDPSGTSREDNIEDILRSMRDGDILLVHNIDEFPGPGLLPICRAIVTGKVSDPDTPFRDGYPGSDSMHSRRGPIVIPMSRLADFTIIATTNSPDAVAMSLHESMIRISVQRSVIGTRAAITRSLRARSLSCTEAAIDLLSRVVMVAKDDIFEEMMAFAIAQCRRGGADVLDADRARRVASAAWALMPGDRAVESLRKASELEGIPVDQMCERLCVPPSLSRNLTGGRDRPKASKKLSEVLEAAMEDDTV